MDRMWSNIPTATVPTAGERGSSDNDSRYISQASALGASPQRQQSSAEISIARQRSRMGANRAVRRVGLSLEHASKARASTAIPHAARLYSIRTLPPPISGHLRQTPRGWAARWHEHARQPASARAMNERPSSGPRRGSDGDVGGWQGEGACATTTNGCRRDGIDITRKHRFERLMDADNACEGDGLLLLCTPFLRTVSPGHCHPSVSLRFA